MVHIDSIKLQQTLNKMDCFLKMHIILHYELAQMISTKSYVYRSNPFSSEPVLLNPFPSSRLEEH